MTSGRLQLAELKLLKIKLPKNFPTDFQNLLLKCYLMFCLLHRSSAREEFYHNLSLDIYKKTKWKPVSLRSAYACYGERLGFLKILVYFELRHFYLFLMTDKLAFLLVSYILVDLFVEGSLPHLQNLINFLASLSHSFVLTTRPPATQAR